jgi:hypothetical protein
MYGIANVSKVTLPVWPGQGYGLPRLSSGLLGPFVFLSILRCYFCFMYDLDICILDSIESTWLYCILFCGFLRELV